MTMLILSMLLIGATLGMRFKVLVLIPAIGLASIAIFAGGIARGDGASVVLIAAVVASGGLQVGYLCGILARYRLAAARRGRPRKAALQAKSAH